jgi:hypothetical protein
MLALVLVAVTVVEVERAGACAHTHIEKVSFRQTACRSSIPTQATACCLSQALSQADTQAIAAGRQLDACAAPGCAGVANRESVLVTSHTVLHVTKSPDSRRRRRRRILPAVTEQEGQAQLVVAWRRRRPALGVERETLAARTAPL